MGHDLLFCPDRVTPSATAGRGGVDLTEGYYLLREGDPRETFAYHRATLMPLPSRSAGR